MGRKRPKSEEIVAKLRQVDVLIGQGQSVAEAVRIAANVAVIPRLTFASDSGAFCRQFDVASVKGVTSAIACRDGGTWRTELAVFGKGGMSADYQTASGAKAPALEAFIDRHMSGLALDAAAETKAISDGWPR